MHRFFIKNTSLAGPYVALSEAISRQVARVLRLRPGDSIVVLDGLGNESVAILTEVNDTHCLVRIETVEKNNSEPGIRLHMLLGLTQREKFEWMLQKCTEIGAATYLPFVSSRCLTQKPEEAEEKRERWEKILQEAAEQSHRGRIPELLPAARLKDALASRIFNDSLKLVLWEEETRNALKPVLAQAKGRDVVVLIGPEGGLSAEEVNLAGEFGFQPVSLGKRILRMETAAVAVAAQVLYELD